MVEIVLYVIAGALTSWFASWWYYVRSGEALRKEAETLRCLTERVTLLMGVDFDLKYQDKIDEKSSRKEVVADTSNAQSKRRSKTDFMMEPSSGD